MVAGQFQSKPVEPLPAQFLKSYFFKKNAQVMPPISQLKGLKKILQCHILFCFIALRDGGNN